MNNQVHVAYTAHADSVRPFFYTVPEVSYPVHNNHTLSVRPTLGVSKTHQQVISRKISLSAQDSPQIHHNSLSYHLFVMARTGWSPCLDTSNSMTSISEDGTSGDGFSPVTAMVAIHEGTSMERDNTPSDDSSMQNQMMDFLMDKRSHSQVASNESRVSRTPQRQRRDPHSAESVARSVDTDCQGISLYNSQDLIDDLGRIMEDNLAKIYDNVAHCEEPDASAGHPPTMSPTEEIAASSSGAVPVQVPNISEERFPVDELQEEQQLLQNPVHEDAPATQSAPIHFDLACDSAEAVDVSNNNRVESDSTTSLKLPLITVTTTDSWCTLGSQTLIVKNYSRKSQQ